MRKFRISSLPKDTLLISIVSIVIGVGLLGGSLLYKQYKGNNHSQTSNGSEQTEPTPSPTPTPIEEGPTAENITDTEFFTYTNSLLGLSLQLPKTAVNQYGGCQYVGAYDSFTSQYSSTRLKVFEDPRNSQIHIGFEYYYQLAGNKKESGSLTYTDCRLVINSTESINQAIKSTSDQTGALWTINYRRVLNDAELERYVKDIHGEGCVIKNKSEYSPGVFDMQIETADAMNNTCTLNYNYILQYSTNKKYAVSWKVGQTDQIFRRYDTNLDIYQAYDDYIVKSFKLQ